MMSKNESNSTKKICASKFLSEGKGIVTLCSSTRFFFEAMEVSRRLTFLGWIVLSCGSWGHSFHKYSSDVFRDYSDVKKLHYLKISLSEAIVVVSDASGYIGDSTKAEIEYAKYKNIPVFNFDGYTFYGETDKQPIVNVWYEQLLREINEYSKLNSLGY